MQINYFAVPGLLENINVTSPATPKNVLSQVSSFLNIDIGQIIGKSRKEKVVFSRHLSIYVLRNNTSLSTREIADSFGNRDHTTIIHSVKHISDILTCPIDTDIKQQAIEFMKRFRYKGLPEKLRA